MISIHSTYFSMENYKADANLMIGDMMVTMTDDGDDDDVFISMLETRKRFWEMRIAWVCKLLKSRELFSYVADIWRQPRWRMPGRASKKQTFRKF